MLLDRILDYAATQITPFAICEVRRGVRIEIAAADAALLHCVVRGHGMLWTTADDDALPLAPASVAIVPARSACFIEPLGGSSRAISLDASGTSDHIARLVAGAGEPGLVIISARLRSYDPGALGSFDALPAPLVVDLSDVEGALSSLEEIEHEQHARRAANRRMIELLLERCLIQALRKAGNDGESAALPWLSELRDKGLARALTAMLRAPATKHSLRSLAEVAGLSQRAFAVRFAQAFGHAPLALLARVRTRAAADSAPTTRAFEKTAVGLPAARAKRAR